MLHVRTGESLGALVTGLLATLRTPLSDPMIPEWIGTPTQGVMAWLEIELAEHLGARPGRNDGIAANLELQFSGDLQRRLRRAGGVDADTDPWHVDRMVWAVLDVLAGASSDAASPIAAVAQPHGGATRYGTARRLADLLDRYVSNRPEMVRRWAEGDDIDGAGLPIDAGAAWQPALFRLVRERIGAPSPAERLEEMLSLARGGDPAIGLPERISLFGFTSLPGGRTFLHQLVALADTREVHLHLWQPSPGLHAWVRGDVVAHPPERSAFGLSRAAADATAAQLHPLVRSWAIPSREASVLLAAERSDGLAITAAELSSPPRTTLLGQLQAQLRTGRPREAPFTFDPDDDSLQVLACHGQIRQVEVLRDEILHLLDGDCSLDESDIVVLCPNLTEYAPLVEAVFGPAAATGTASEGAISDAGATTGAPRLAYQITDRSLTRANPVLAALAGLLDMSAGRFGASTVRDFIGLQSVRDRYGFSHDEFVTITSWIEALDVRWGLDAASRSNWIEDDSYDAGTWAVAIDRLLTGVALSDAHDRLAIGSVLPFGVEGTQIELLGRLAELMERLAGLAAAVTVPRPIGDWCRLLGEVVTDFFRAPTDQHWQVSSVQTMLLDVAEQATATDRNSADAPDVALTLADIQRLVSDRAVGSSPSTKFFRGGITVTSLAPLRGVPFRVVCILGFDDDALRSTGADGDDLMALTPMIGDRDRRAEVRQSLLEAVMATTDRLVITRTGRSRLNNKSVPMTATLAELRDSLVDGHTFVDAAAVDRAIQRDSTCNSFDPENFRGDRRSFDPVALGGALMLGGAQVKPPPFLAAPLALDGPVTVVELDDLQRMLRSPAEFFLTRRLGAHLTEDGGGGDDEIALELNNLESWSMGERLLDSLRSGRTVEQFRSVEAAKGSLPPGIFGENALGTAEALTQGVLDIGREFGVLQHDSETQPIDIVLPSGLHLVGSIEVVRSPTHIGPVQLGVAKLKAKRLLRSWLELLALAVSHPSEPWSALLIGQADRPKAGESPAVSKRLRLCGGGQSTIDAAAALDVVLDLYQRSLCEALPIFPATTPRRYDDMTDSTSRASSEWSRGRPGEQFGDRHHSATQLVFGDLAYDELLALPARVDEKLAFGISESSRLSLYAQRLWGTFHESCVVDSATSRSAQETDDE